MERESPRKRRTPVPLRLVARECGNIPTAFVELDTSELSAHLVTDLEFLESWRDIKALLNREAPGFLPTESVVDTFRPVRTNRSQPLGGGEAEDWLGTANDSEKLAATCKLSNNMLAYHLLMGRGLPANYRFSDLGAALKDLSAQLLEWPNTAVGTTPNPEKLEALPRMSADTVLRSIKGKMTTTAQFMSRFTVVPYVAAYAGVSVFVREMVFYLRIDNTEFKLGETFVPDYATAQEILRHWERTGGGRYEAYELTPEEEERIPMLIGLIRYQNSSGVRKFTVTTPPVAVSRSIPSVYTALDDATAIVRKFEEYLQTWTPPAQFGPDHIPLFAEMCRNIDIDWDNLTLVSSRDRYLSYYDLSMATYDDPGDFTDDEIEKYSLIERANELLEEAARFNNSNALISAFVSPKAKIGQYTFATDPATVIRRLNAARDSIRNTYGQREYLYRGNTYPGLPFGSPDGGSTYLKICEVLKRLYALEPKCKEVGHVLFGVGYTLAMGPAFPKNTEFCDVALPKHVAKHVPITVANALNLRRPDGSMVDIANKVYISDIYGGPTKPADHFRQIDAVCIGRPACGAIKCFIDNPTTVAAAAGRLSQYYARVFYCGVTKAHTGEFFLCFAGLKPQESEAAPNVEQQCLLFLALHSLRTDLANYFYSGHVRAGVMDFSKFKRIDSVIQRHGLKYLGRVWSRTVSVSEVEALTGKKERVGAIAGVETLSLADLEEIDYFADLVAEDEATALSGPLPPKDPILKNRRKAGGTPPSGHEEEVEEIRGESSDDNEDEPPEPDYGTRRRGKGKDKGKERRK